MLSRHFQEACTPVLPPLTLAPPGNSVLRCIALGPQLDFSLFDILHIFYLACYCLACRPQFWFTFFNFAIPLLLSMHSSPLQSRFFSQCRLFYLLHFPAALVLSCSFGRKCSRIWQVLEVGFPGFSHLGKKKVRKCGFSRAFPSRLRCENVKM